MESNITVMESPAARTCPFLEVECKDLCPAWLDQLNDCLFHVCMTDVREVFTEAAAALDKNLGLLEGMGMQTITGLRQVITGEIDDEQREVVRSVLSSLISGAVMAKVSRMSAADIGDFISEVESSLTFSIGGLWGSDALEES